MQPEILEKCSDCPSAFYSSSFLRLLYLPRHGNDTLHKNYIVIPWSWWLNLITQAWVDLNWAKYTGNYCSEFKVLNSWIFNCIKVKNHINQELDEVESAWSEKKTNKIVKSTRELNLNTRKRLQLASPKYECLPRVLHTNFTKCFSLHCSPG